MPATRDRHNDATTKALMAPDILELSESAPTVRLVLPTIPTKLSRISVGVLVVAGRQDKSQGTPIAKEGNLLTVGTGVRFI